MGVLNVKRALRVDCFGAWLSICPGSWRRRWFLLNHGVLHLGRSNGFDGNRFNDQGALKWREAKALLISYFKGLGNQVNRRLEVKRQCGITPLAPHLHTMHQSDLRRVLALRLKITASNS